MIRLYYNLLVKKSNVFQPLSFLRFKRQRISSSCIDGLAVDDNVKLTDSCVNRLRVIYQDPSNKSKHLRLLVDGGGCSGFQYKFSLDNEVNKSDLVIQRGGVHVLVDAVSIEYIKGSTVDFHEELIRSAFRVINNPKSQQDCSCGTSFAVYID